MGTISNAVSIHGITATGQGSSTRVDGSLSLGKGQTQAVLTGCDVFYSLSITSTGASDVATLTLSSGSVAQTTGTPTIADGDGKDFEGATLATLADIQSVHVSFDEVAAGTIVMACADTNLPDITASTDGMISHTIISSGKTLSGSTISFTFDDAASQKVTVTVAGKTA